MKKFIFLCLLLLTGCKVNSKNFLKKLSKFNEENKTYVLSGKININHTDITSSYTFETACLNDFLKVSLTNTFNNTKQVIIKNKDGVFILSPELNKTFKFPTNWPNEKTCPYIIDELFNDIMNNENVEILDLEEEINVKYDITNKMNLNIKNCITSFNKNLIPKYSKYYDESDTLRLEVIYESFNKDVNLSESDFLINTNMVSLILQIGEGTSNKEFSLPTYLPYNVKSSKITLDEAILVSYSGDESYTIYQKKQDMLEENVIDGNYDDYVLLKNGVGLYNKHKLAWYNGGIMYEIYSNTLEVSELIDIANSIV